MRCLDTTSGCSADVRVFADKVPCSEYQVSGEGTNVQGWIPIVSGQQLTIQCDLEMSSFSYHADLIVDGILRNVWTSTIGQKAKLRDAHFEFEEGIFKCVRSLHRSPMKTARLGQGNIILDCLKPCLLRISSRIFLVKRHNRWDDRDPYLQAR